MQLDVGMEPTFRFGHMICICKEMGIVRYEICHRQTDRQTENDAYEPTVQFAQVGSNMAAKLVFTVLKPQFNFY